MGAVCKTDGGAAGKLSKKIRVAIGLPLLGCDAGRWRRTTLRATARRGGCRSGCRSSSRVRAN